MKKRIISVLSALAGAVAGAAAVGNMADKAVNKARNMSDKHLALFLMMNQWVQVKQEGKNLAEYMEKHNYRMIAIYGMSYAGERVLAELKGSNITVKYGIDRSADSLYSDIEIVSPDGELEDVDAIVVTPIFLLMK